MLETVFPGFLGMSLGVVYLEAATFLYRVGTTGKRGMRPDEVL